VEDRIEMETISSTLMTLYELLRRYPAWLVFLACLIVAIRAWKGNLSLRLGFSSKALGSWSVQIERGNITPIDSNDPPKRLNQP
jgi:hypothetical protein